MHSWTLHQTRRVLALGIGSCLALSACSPSERNESEANHGAQRSGRTTLFSLLGSFDKACIQRAPEGAQIRVDLLQPARINQDLGGSRPALILEGNSIVQLPLPDGPRDRELLVGIAPHQDSWEGGRVTARVRAGNELLLETTIACSPSTPEGERTWQEVSLPLPPEAKEISLETAWDGGEPEFQVLGFGRLEVHLPYAVSAQAANEQHPNIVLIVVDTLRADRLGQGGNGRDTSPVMDTLAAGGARLTQAFSSGPWTLPGTASILTGLTPPEHGLGASPTGSLAHPLFTLPEALQHQGWLTAGFVMNPLISPGSCFDQGFHHFVSRRWGLAEQFEGEWLTWLEENSEERFFLYLHLIEPHFPYSPSKESCSALGIDFAKGKDHLDLRQPLKTWYAEGVGSASDLREMAARHLDLYDAEVLDADRAIGRVLDQLKSLGVYDQTLICITSDHGEEFIEHGWAQHDAQLMDESLHVPLVFSGPGVPVGEVIEGPVENRHLAQTLLALAMVEGEGAGTSSNLLDPESLKAVLDGGAFSMHTRGRWCDLESREMVLLGQSHSLRQGPWELLACPNTDLPGSPAIIRLYHTGRDPNKTWDLSGEEPVRAVRMRNEIEAWIQAGLAIQPPLRPTSAETRSMLEKLGYGGG